MLFYDMFIIVELSDANLWFRIKVARAESSFFESKWKSSDGLSTYELNVE